MSFNQLIATPTAVTRTDAAFGLWPLARTWRTFPGARLTNGQGLKAVPRFDVA
jgi:hypothetical protein